MTPKHQHADYGAKYMPTEREIAIKKKEIRERNLAMMRKGAVPRQTTVDKRYE